MKRMLSGCFFVFLLLITVQQVFAETNSCPTLIGLSPRERYPLTTTYHGIPRENACVYLFDEETTVHIPESFTATYSDSSKAKKTAKEQTWISTQKVQLIPLHYEAMPTPEPSPTPRQFVPPAALTSTPTTMPTVYRDTNPLRLLVPDEEERDNAQCLKEASFWHCQAATAITWKHPGENAELVYSLNFPDPGNAGSCYFTVVENHRYLVCLEKGARIFANEIYYKKPSE